MRPTADRRPGEAAVGAADLAERRDRPRAHAVAAHQRDRVVVVGLHARVEVAQVAGELRRARDLGARAARQLGGEADVVVVLVGEDEQLEVLDGDPEGGEAGLQARLGLLHARPGVDQRERAPAQQVGVHVPDLERRRQRDAVDVLGQHVLRRFLRTAQAGSYARRRSCRA